MTSATSSLLQWHLMSIHWNCHCQRELWSSINCPLLHKNKCFMTPQDLVRALLQTNEEQGHQLLQIHVPVFSQVALDKLVYLVKKEADHCWNHNVQLSFTLAGYLLFIGD